MTHGNFDIVASNRQAWDASARYHRTGERWNRLIKGFGQPGYSTFDTTVEGILKSLPIKGKSLVQPCCNNGQEVLSAVSLGASRALGIDQSAEFLKQAEELKGVAGLDCSFICADIYQLPAELDHQFDIAMLTIGVLYWMPDLAAFFAAVGRLCEARW